MPELNEFENLTALDKTIGRDRAAMSSSGNTGGAWALRRSTERCFFESTAHCWLLKSPGPRGLKDYPRTLYKKKKLHDYSAKYFKSNPVP